MCAVGWIRTIDGAPKARKLYTRKKSDFMEYNKTDWNLIGPCEKYEYIYFM